MSTDQDGEERIREIVRDELANSGSSGVSRRGVLAGALGLGTVGAGLGTYGANRVAAQDGSSNGYIGTAENPVGEIHADTINTDALDALSLDELNLQSLSTGDLSHITPDQSADVSQSVWSNLSSGRPVVVTSRGGARSVSWDDFGTDDAALQHLNDWATDSRNVACDIFFSPIKPDGNAVTVENPVHFGQSDNGRAVRLHVKASGHNGVNTVYIDIDDGSQAFYWTGNLNENISIGSGLYGGHFNCNNQDAGLVRFRRCSQFECRPHLVRSYAGDAVVADTNSFGFTISGRYRARNQEASNIVFENTGNGAQPGNGAISESCVMDSEHGVGIEDRAEAPGVRVSGHFEQAYGDAEIVIEGNGWVITPDTRVSATNDGAHGTLVNSGAEAVIAPSNVSGCSGDAINLDNPSMAYVSPYCRFIDNDGYDINLNDRDAGNHGVIPYPESVYGDVNYISDEWNNWCFPDGKRLVREGTTTVNAGSTSTATEWGGFSGSRKELEWGFASDPGAAVEVEPKFGEWNASASQRYLRFEELSGNGSAEIDWRILSG